MNAPQASQDNGKNNPAGKQERRSETVECVACPKSYEVFKGPRHPSGAAKGSGSEKVAVFIAHGMGQQLPYDTQTKLALKLRNYLMPKSKSLLRTRQVLIGDQRYSRVEFVRPAADGTPAREVHVYEAYWAPLTEGEVRIRDVTGFLFRAGWNGFLRAFNHFRRWLFGSPVKFDTRKWLKGQISLALLFVSSLVLLNATIGLVAATRFLGDVKSSTYWSEDRIAALSGTLMPLLVVSGLLLLESESTCQKRRPKNLPLLTVSQNAAC